MFYGMYLLECFIILSSYIILKRSKRPSKWLTSYFVFSFWLSVTIPALLIIDVCSRFDLSNVIQSSIGGLTFIIAIVTLKISIQRGAHNGGSIYLLKILHDIFSRNDDLFQDKSPTMIRQAPIHQSDKL